MIVIKRSIDIDNMMGWGRGKKSRLRLTGRGGFLRLFCTRKRVFDAHEECEKRKVTCCSGYNLYSNHTSI
jgi:hypothetical protein